MPLSAEELTQLTQQITGNLQQAVVTEVQRASAAALPQSLAESVLASDMVIASSEHAGVIAVAGRAVQKAVDLALRVAPPARDQYLKDVGVLSAEIARLVLVMHDPVQLASALTSLRASHPGLFCRIQVMPLAATATAQQAPLSGQPAAPAAFGAGTGNAGGQPFGARGKGKTGACHKCGVVGHWANDCPMQQTLDSLPQALRALQSAALHSTPSRDARRSPRRSRSHSRSPRSSRRS